MEDNVLSLITELKYLIYLRAKGGKGSGGWGHSGRKGKRGGSKAGSGGLSKIGANPKMHPYKRKKLAKKVTEEKRLIRKARATRRKVLAIQDRATKQLTGLEKERKEVYAKYAPFKEKVIHNIDMMIADKISMAEFKRRDAVIKKESAKATKGIANFHAKENKIFEGIIQKQRRLLYAKNGPAELDIKFTGEFDSDRKRHIQGGIDEFSKMIGRGTILDSQTIMVGHAEDGRSYQMGGDIIMASNAGVLSTIHELGHSLEFVAGSRLSAAPNLKANVNTQTVKFLNHRTEGEKARKLSDIRTGDHILDSRKFNDNEIAKPDKFSDPYMGKIYSQGTTEILSMGIEKMWDNPAKFAKDDPDYFDFMLVTLENSRSRG